MQIPTPWRLAACLWGLSGCADAAGDFDFSGASRFRYESIQNQPRTGFNLRDDLFNVRTTLHGEYRTDAVTLVAELWDSRVYGGNTGTPITTGEVNTLEFAQAYAAVEMGFGATKVKLQAGRFTLNIGSRRLVAADDYRNTTSGYTGLHADIAAPAGFNASVILVLPQQRRPDDLSALRRNASAFDHEGLDQVLWGGTFAKRNAIGPVLAEVTYYHFKEQDTPGRPTRDRSLDTYGGRLLREHVPGLTDFEVESFYQSGRISASAASSATPQLPVSAWFAHGSIGYTFMKSWHPRLSLEYDRASGDHPGGSYGHFDTLFGMRRSDLAPAGLYNAVGRTNVSAPGIRLEFTPSIAVDFFATYHALWLADRTDAFSSTGVRDPTGSSGAFAGHQFDSRIRWWILPSRLRFEYDQVLLRKGRFMRDAPNAPPGGTTSYESVNLTIQF